MQRRLGEPQPWLVLPVSLQRCVFAVYNPGDFLGVLPGEHAFQRHGNKLRVAQVPVAVGKRVPCRLDEKVQALGGVVSERSEVEVVQDVERLQRGCAAAGNRYAQDVVLPVPYAGRLCNEHLEIGEVLDPEQAAVLSHVLFDRVRDLALV